MFVVGKKRTRGKFIKAYFNRYCQLTILKDKLSFSDLEICFNITVYFSSKSACATKGEQVKNSFLFVKKNNNSSRNTYVN